MAHGNSGQALAAWWEKSGNTSWVQCACTGWFPVSDPVLAAQDTLMHCPHCHRDFTQAGATRIERT
jgi:hypothetical protein